MVGLDRALRDTNDATPLPDWAKGDEFVLAPETALLAKAAALDAEIADAQQRRAGVSIELEEAGRLRGLLFEKGKPLERAIIVALTALGFRAEPFRDANSEFDVVFECDEGRFIGEAEGKDNKAINIDKLRQLNLNIHEDLQREGVEKPAKGVLFGNAHRLSPPDDTPKRSLRNVLTRPLSAPLRWFPHPPYLRSRPI
jgi:hypothetical protein